MTEKIMIDEDVVTRPQDLKDEEQELLKHIYGYGGYVRTTFLEDDYYTTHYNTIYRKLKSLENRKYLVSRKMYTDSCREAVSFQVTQKTCKLFKNPQSYFRKKHTKEYIYRALVKSKFCFEQHNNIGKYIETDHEQRVGIFRELGYSEMNFPRKYNGKDNFIHFEELLIDLRNTDENYEIIDAEQDVIFKRDKPRIIIVYVDKVHVNAVTQYENLIKKYRGIIDENKVKLDFLIVTDILSRKYYYKKEIRKSTVNDGKNHIKDVLIKLYTGLFLGAYKEDEKKVNDYKKRFENGEIGRKVRLEYSRKIEYMDDEMRIIYKEISREGYREFLKNQAEYWTKKRGTLLDALEEMIGIFEVLFVLDYNNLIKELAEEKEEDFSVKVYKVDGNFKMKGE